MKKRIPQEAYNSSGSGDRGSICGILCDLLQIFISGGQAGKETARIYAFGDGGEMADMIALDT